MDFGYDDDTNGVRRKLNEVLRQEEELRRKLEKYGEDHPKASAWDYHKRRLEKEAKRLFNKIDRL